MAMYDDVERRLCECCGEVRDVRTMSMIGSTGRWICRPCYQSRALDELAWHSQLWDRTP